MHKMRELMFDYYHQKGTDANICAIPKNENPNEYTQDYVSLAAYKSMNERFEYWISHHDGVEPNFIWVVARGSAPAQTPSAVPPQPSKSCNGEWYDENGTKRKGYTSPLCQTEDWNCSCYSVMQVIYQLTGRDISIDEITDWGWHNTDLNSNGVGHSGLEKILKHFAPELSIHWVNFSDLGMDGLRRILENHCQTFISHTLLSNAYGHYQIILKVFDDQVLERYSVGNCQNRILSGSTYREWLGGISQPSIGVVSL